MVTRRLAAVLGVLALVLAACGGGGTGDGSEEPGGASSGATSDCKVAVSWNNYQEERWALRDEPNMQAALEEAGAEYDSADAACRYIIEMSRRERLKAAGVLSGNFWLTK